MSQTPPNRGTRALNSGANTTSFGDAFVQSPDAPRQSQNVTRPLKLPPSMLKDAVPARIAETKRDLDYVRHLVDLFRPFVNILRLAELLNAAPPEEEVSPLSSESEEEESSPPPPSEYALWEAKIAALRVTLDKQQLAVAIADKIRDNARLQQRIQITLHQYGEAESGYAVALKSFNIATNSPPGNAWDILDQIGIERLKGKAYAICGFYDNYKDDPVLSQVFPPPNLTPQQPRFNMNSAAPSRQPSATRPLPKETPPPKKPGFLDSLKGIFGK